MLESPSEKKWYSIGEWDQPLLYTSLDIEYSLSKYSKILTPGITGEYMVHQGEFVLARKDFEYFRQKAQDERFLKKAIELQKKAFKELNAYIRKHKSPHVSDNEGALAVVKMFVKVVRDFNYFFLVGLFLDPIVMEQISHEVDFETVAGLVSPKKKSDLTREMDDLRLIRKMLVDMFGENISILSSDQMAEVIKDRKGNLLKKLQVHEKKYSYLSVHLFKGIPWSLRDYIDRAKTLNEISQEIPKQGGRARLSQKTSRLIKYARELNEQRQIRIEYLNKFVYQLWPVWEYCMRTFGITKREFTALSYEELQDSLVSGNMSVSREELELRNIRYYAKFSKGKSVWHSEPVQKREEVNIKVVKGFSAFKGRVSGEVQIVRGTDDFQKFKEGSILVAPLTTPNLMAVIYKAKAIVTDVGGITSHAAIVSRELHIPCIIGTKIATKVLKDGDMVDVDANNGVVTVIKKAE